MLKTSNYSASSSLEFNLHYLRKYLSTPSSESNEIPGALLQIMPVLQSSEIDKAVQEISTLRYHQKTPLFSKSELSNEDWHSFQSSWSRLIQDKHMGDNGTYRFRRYSTLGWRSSDGKVFLMPHMPLFQTIDVNGLNGGKERWFEPIEPAVLNNPIFLKTFYYALSIFTKREANLGLSTDWFIEIDQFRIVANYANAGNPTPEGIHTDGTDYFLSMLIERKNITGGISTVYDMQKNPMFTTTLNDATDALLVNDRENTMHGVSPIKAATVEGGYRDIIILSFTNRNHPESIRRRFGVNLS